MEGEYHLVMKKIHYYQILYFLFQTWELFFPNLLLSSF